MHRLTELDERSVGISTQSGARLLLGLVGRQKASTAWGVLTSGVWNASQVFVPVAIGRAIDLGITGRDRGQLLLWSGVVLALGVLRAAALLGFYRQNIIMRTVSGGLTAQLITRHVARLGASLPEQHDVGDVTATVTADVTSIGNGLLHLGRALGSIVAVAVVTAIMLAISLPLGLLVVITVPSLLALGSLLLRPLHNHQDSYRSIQARLAARAVDIAAGLRVLRGVGGEARLSSVFRADSRELRVADIKVAKAEANLDGVRVFMPGLLAAVVTYTAARFALDQQVTVGQLISFYGFAVFLALPLYDITEGTNQITRALVSARRVAALLETDSGPEREAASARRGLGRASRGENHLSDPASGLEVPARSLLAVASAETADAESIARRITRFADPGEATLDGTLLSRLPLAQVRSQIVFASNSDLFFGGTVREEVGLSATPEQLHAALEVACALDVVGSRVDGLDSRMFGRGRVFSGGELQRLRLARALLAGADVTVLFEPTNAVDAYTEHTIAVNLAEYHAGSGGTGSIVVFTVSPLLLRHAQRVAYVVDGHVRATGTHHELLARHPGYRELVSRDVVSVGEEQ